MLSILKKTLITTVRISRSVSNLSGIKFEELTENRYEEVMDHLREVTYKDVPLYKAAGLVGEGRAPVELDNVYLNSIKEGVSMVALDKGKFAGVLINGILTPDAIPGAIQAMKTSSNENYKKMDFMFLKLLLDLDIFNRFGIDRAMECRLLSTTREYRGSGLGRMLVDQITTMARDLDYPIVLGEAVNDFLWKLLVSEGWIMLTEMPYSDYTSEATGKPLYKVDPPHHILGLCARIIDNRCKCRDPLPLPNIKLVYPIKMD